MNTNDYVRKCLEHGNIFLSSYCSDLLCATLELQGNELFRVYSNNGTDHVLLALASKVLNNNYILKKANKHFPYPVSPTAPEQDSTLYRLVQDGSVSIFLIKDIVHLEQYVSTMQSLKQKPKPSFRKSHGHTLSEAVEKIKDADPEPVTCVPTIIT